MGYGHPDRLLAVLDYRQQRELEIFARIEPIEGVSQPAEPDEKETDEDGRQVFERICDMLGTE